MIQGTLQNFIAIFKDHVTADADLKYFAYGEVFEVEKRIQSDAANFDTPLLWLDEPEVTPNRNRTNLYSNSFTSAVWLIVSLPSAHDYETIESGYSEAHALLDRVVAMLYRLQRERVLVDFKIGKEEAISRKFVRTGNLIGWRMEVSISLETTLIHHIN